MTLAARKHPKMKSEPGEGRAHESSEAPDDEVREGADDRPRMKTNRKRSAKGAKHTKAPMDTEGGCCNTKKGKAPCSACASGKPCSGKTMKDAGCNKRGDALTPQEYLAACDLGIHNRGRSYIRARLDAAARLDKKCGASGIADNKKCNKGGGGNGFMNAAVAGAAIGGVGLVAATKYQEAKQKEADAKRVIQKVGVVRHKANSGIRAAALAAKNGVENARTWTNLPKEVNREALVNNAIQHGMQSIHNAKTTRRAAYAESRAALSELAKEVPQSPARRRKAAKGSAPSGKVVRKVRRQGKVTRLNSMYADGFWVDLAQLEV